MSMVRLSFSPAPAHVRTARLVGVAVARRAGVAEELLEEIRLAIGEACSRAVALHRAGGLLDLIDMIMTEDERFMVEVIDRATTRPTAEPDPSDAAAFLAAAEQPAPHSDVLAEEAVAARMGLALLAGLVEDLEVAVVPGGAGTRVRMSWPLGRHKRDDEDE